MSCQVVCIKCQLTAPLQSAQNHRAISSVVVHQLWLSGCIPTLTVLVHWIVWCSCLADCLPGVFESCADVTRRAAQLLLAHRSLLAPPQLARLAARMAEVGMLQEITGLVDSSVASGSHQGQAVGFVAAALTGNLTEPAETASV